MNLVRENMTLPLYIKKFENIYKVSEKIELNQALLWIIKEGYVFTSIGLHNLEAIGNEHGKSSLLNEIFPTHFELTQNKHAIIQGIPYIAIRVF